MAALAAPASEVVALATAAAPSRSSVVAAEQPMEGPFAPLFTHGTEPYALAELDELGRPLASVYVPDALLL